MSEFKIVEVSLYQIKHGDTVLHNGHIVTVDRKYLKISIEGDLSFMGDSYRSGYKLVKKVLFPQWRNGEVVGYA
ncbi:hypothetical protein ACX1NX_02995 [Acinetobacter sp. ANC 5383]